MSSRVLNIVTGEYPPQPGGVSDYTALLANGLAGRGEEIHVWTSAVARNLTTTRGVFVHGIAGRWSPPDLIRLGEELDRFPAPRRLLIQHVPNTWGHRGLNLQFCNWVISRKQHGDDISLMVHEPYYPWVWREKPTRWLLSAVQRRMMRKLLAASSRVFISIPAWEKYLRPYAPNGRLEMTWLPIFSTIPVVRDERLSKEIRVSLAPKGEFIIGSFGTYGSALERLLFTIIPALLLIRNDLVVALAGSGGVEFWHKFKTLNPNFAKRVIPSGSLPSEKLSAFLQACDLLVQPYPDGISSRRTSVMAGLSHGIPIVSNTGFLSEPIWADSRCVALSPTTNCTDFAKTTETYINDPSARASLAARATSVYEQHFALENTIDKIINAG